MILTIEELEKQIAALRKELARRPRANSKYYTTKELAAVINRSERWVIKWRDTGRIPGATRIGRLWNFDRKVVDRLLRTGKFFNTIKKNAP